MKKVVLYSLIVIAAIALIVWKLQSNKKESETHTNIVRESNSGAVAVTIETVRDSVFATAFNANGNFAPINQIDFSAESTGRIVALMAKEGDVVHKGQVLARIDNQVVSADLQKAKANVSQARRDLERYQAALASGGVTQKQVDDMALQLANAQAGYTAASKNEQNTTLKSPIDGIINTKYVEIGAYLSAGTKLFEIVNISRLKLVVSVPESQIIQLKTGQAVQVRTNVFPDATYQGKLTFIAPKGDASLNYAVEVEVVNIAGKQLRAGMYGTAVFEVPQQDPAILIPGAAFYQGISSNTIFAADNGKAVLRKVVPGRIFGNKVEILGGLQKGETIITSGQVNLIDGTVIAAQKK